MTLSPASSGIGSVGGAGSVTLLSSSVLGSTAQFDVSAISQAFNDLILVLMARSSGAVDDEYAHILFNADGGAHYNYSTLLNAGIGSTALATSGLAAYVPGSTAPASVFGCAEIYLHGYANTSRFKTWQTQAGEQATVQALSEINGNWISAAAITRVQIQSTSGTGFLAGSELRIYGRL